MFYNGTGIRWNGEEFESVNTGSGWVEAVKLTTGLTQLITATHGNLDSMPTTEDISYRAVPAEP